MKDITNELEIKLSQEFSKEFPKLPAEKLTCEGIKIPTSVIEKLINFGKKYEAESICDIKNNYNKLMVCHVISLSLFKWSVNFIREFYKRYGELPESKEEKLYPLKKRFFPPSVGLNLCNLDSIRVRDIKHIPNEYSPSYKFKAIELNVYDRFNENMPAVFVYKGTLSIPLKDEEDKKQLEEVLNSNPLDTFNISFLLLDEKVKRKMLKIISIQKNKLDDKETIEIPEKSEEVYDLEKILTIVPFLLRV